MLYYSLKLYHNDKNRYERKYRNRKMKQIGNNLDELKNVEREYGVHFKRKGFHNNDLLEKRFLDCWDNMTRGQISWKKAKVKKQYMINKKRHKQVIKADLKTLQ